jgi:hypothetical protein
MDYSVIVLPVTKADKTVDTADLSYEPLNDVDELNWKACKFCNPSSVFDIKKKLNSSS